MKQLFYVFLISFLFGSVGMGEEQKVFRGKEYNEMEFFNFLGGSGEKKQMKLPEIKTKAKFNDQVIQYIATLDAQYMYCDVRINNMSAMTNENAYIGALTGSFDFLESIKDGSNEVSIEVADLFFINPVRYFPQKFKDEKLEEKYRGWADQYSTEIKFLSEKSREIHLNDGYCSLLIEAQILGDKLERRPIAYLKIVRDEDEAFQISEESYGFLAETKISPNSSIKSEIISRNEGWIEDVFKVSRTINIKNIPEWSWVNAPKFNDIPNNVALLKKAYQDFWTVLNSHDEDKIKAYVALSLDELSMAKGYANRDNAKVQELWAYIYDRLGYGSLVSDGYQMIPLDFTDFEVKQSIDGKLVRFVKKGYKLQPPIGYIRSGSETPSYLHHYFAYINGKFILVR